MWLRAGALEGDSKKCLGENFVRKVYKQKIHIFTGVPERTPNVIFSTLTEVP